MSRSTFKRMTEHITLLGFEHKIRLTWITSGWDHAESFPEERTAYVPVITRGSDYLVALHELGHCADPLARSLVWTQDIHGLVLTEGAAWAWAAENALAPLRNRLTAKDWALIGTAFGSYIRRTRSGGYETALRARVNPLEALQADSALEPAPSPHTPV